MLAYCWNTYITGALRMACVLRHVNQKWQIIIYVYCTRMCLDCMQLNRNYTICSDRAMHKLNTSHLHIGNGKRIVLFSFDFFLRLSLCRSSRFLCCNSFCHRRRHYPMWITNANSCKLHSTNPCIWCSLQTLRTHIPERLRYLILKFQAGFDAIHSIFTHIAEVITFFPSSGQCFLVDSVN